MKHYVKKMEQQTHGARVVNIAFLPYEYNVDGDGGDFIRDFKEDVGPSEMCEIFGFLNEEKVHGYIEDAIKDNEFLYFLMTSGKKYGFVAEINFPILSNITLSEDGEMKSCSLSQGHCHVDYAYGDDIAELTDKIIELSDKWERYDIGKQK